jgi:KipI family sensor histidine kinase inhibitor
MTLPPTVTCLGDSCLCWAFGQDLALATSQRVIAAYRQCQAAKLPGVRDLVPAYNTLAIHFDPLVTEATELAQRLETVFSQPPPVASAPVTCHRLPVCYDGPDLAELAQAKGLTVAEVIHRHTAASYTVAMIGFRPHFPYLLGLDPSLETPRRANPRTRVPAGSVAIGGPQTGIYPEESPGGWHLLGRTPPALLRAIRVGDQVQFTSEPAL